MDLNNSKTYLSLAILGLVVSLLYFLIDKAIETSLLVLYITVYVIAGLKFLLERNYYRRYNAILASLQFVVLPYIIFLFGTYVSPIIQGNLYLGIALEFSFFSIRIITNAISISLIVPLLILSIHFRNFHSKKWAAMAINRKIIRKQALPVLVHLLLVLIIGIRYVFLTAVYDITAIAFIIIFFCQMLIYYIIPAIRRRSATTSRTATTSTRPRSRRTRSSSSRSSRYRRVSTSSSSRSRTASTSSSTSRDSLADRDPGIEVDTRRTTRSKPKTTTGKRRKINIRPKGKLTKDDLKCIICYQDFKKNDKRRVILCPHCKYPAHEDELNMWFANSHLCPRCNTKISITYIKKPKLRMSSKFYVEKVIDKIR